MPSMETHNFPVMASSNAVSLSTRSEEFRRVEYLLKLSLGTATPATNVQVWHFNTPQHAAKFEIHNQHSQVIHAWLLEENACDELIRNHGTLTNFPQRFETGAIVPPNTRRKDVQRLVLCQIAVGKSFVQDYSNDDSTTNRLPDGFDSILQSSNAAAGEDDETYHHEYILFNSYQCLPMYLVQYEVARSARRAAKEELNMYDKYDFFDPVYYVPVSIRDKMVGSHSKGEAANHKLISLQDAYEIALKESEKPDLLLKQTVHELKNQLRQVDTKLRDVNANSARVEEELYKCLQDALFELQQITQHKMQSLLSVEVDLKRKLSHLEWAEQYLARQRIEAKPLEFLTVWKCHSQLRGDICHSEQQQQEVTAHELGQIQADIECTGTVHVREGGNRNALALPAPPHHNQSSRRGSGSMVLSGISPNHSPSSRGEGFEDDSQSPPLYLEDTPQKQPAPPVQPQPAPPPPPQTQAAAAANLPEPNLDVSKAFVEALRMQSKLKSGDFYGDSKRRYGFDGQNSSFLLQQEEVPPTPQKRGPVSNNTRKRHAQFSLYEEACRKLRQLYKANAGKTAEYLAAVPKFDGSMLLSHALIPVEEGKDPNHYFALSLASRLFLTMPGSVEASPRLLYSSRQVGTPRLVDMVNTLPRHQQTMINADGEEEVVETLEHCPTVLLIRANGNRVFGGYIADSFTTSGTFGTPRCFLFSIDQDLKIPFVGRETLPPNRTHVERCRAHGLPEPKFSTMFCDETKLQFGVGDLVLGYDLKQGASELERSYGGLGLSEQEALTLFCGNERFNCEEVEFWAMS